MTLTISVPFSNFPLKEWFKYLLTWWFRSVIRCMKVHVILTFVFELSLIDRRRPSQPGKLRGFKLTAPRGHSRLRTLKNSCPAAVQPAATTNFLIQSFYLPSCFYFTLPKDNWESLPFLSRSIPEAEFKYKSKFSVSKGLHTLNHVS